MSDPPNSTEPTDPQPPFASTSSPVTRPVTAIPLKRTFRPILPKPTTFTYSAEGNFPPTSPDEVIEPHLISDPGLSDSVASTDPSVVTTSVASTSDGTFYEWRHVDLILAEKARVVYDTLGRKRLLCPMPGCRATEAYLSGMRVHIRRHIVNPLATHTATNVPVKITLTAMLPESSTYIIRAKSVFRWPILNPELTLTTCAVEFLPK
uniref:C2H2-type domain-containing protein n=1 Tax=Mesocestoides corti TaxID=53468 RepID=A0A5K3EVI7_MESCO